MPIVYDELRALAMKHFRQRAGVQVAPTSIVHEVYEKLSEAGHQWIDREHFCAVAATAMRQILVDRVRRQKAAKRGGDWERVTLSLVVDDGISGEFDLETLDEALARLNVLDPRQARIVELRFFGGLTVPQVAVHLEVSTSTVEKEWRRARAWLGARLSRR